MQRIFTLLLTIMAAVQLAWADDMMWIDYCDGQKGASTSTVKTTGTVDMAVCFRADDMVSFAGNSLTAIAVGWPTSNPGGDVTVWVRESQTGNNLVEKTVPADNNWMEIVLDTPYAIDGKQDVWVGATFQPNTTRRSFISLAGETHPDGCYYRVGGGEWKSYANLNKGSLAVRARIEGTSLPKHDVYVTDLSTPRESYALKEEIPVTFTIANKAADTCVNPKVIVSLNGNPVAEQTLETSIEYRKQFTTTLTVPSASIEEACKAELKVEVLWADGVSDTKPADNVATKSLDLVKPEYDLTMVGVKCASTVYQCGDPIGVTGTIKNLSEIPCTNPYILYSINGGEQTGECMVKGELNYGKSTTFAIRIPTEAGMASGAVTIDLELVPNLGVQDLDDSNNKATLTGITVEEHPFIQKMVMEEATGTWCGFCVRGIVCMDEMNNIYPDRFIGIAIHNGDSFVNSIYDTWSGANVAKTGYPSCVVNRDGTVRDPNYNSIASLMKTYSSKQAEAEVRPTAWLENGVINMKADCYFAKASSNRKLYVAFAITEDHLKASQSNYFSGGGYGVMGGFENLPNPTIVDFKDVARGIWPEPAGSSSCSLPSAVEAMTTYSASYSLPVAQLTKKNDANVYVAALLIDGATRKIINGGKCAIYGMSAEAPEGVDTVLAPVEEVRGSYNLAGQRVGNLGHGLRIENGRKVIR